MIYTDLSSSKWSTTVKPWTLLICFCLASILLQQTDAVSFGILNTKIYERNGETLNCLNRDKSEACPLDHYIDACPSNLSKVSCVPCEKGLHLCMQIYSAIDDIKCYKVDNNCRPEEEVFIDKDDKGRCMHSECRCKVREGYVKDGLDCVRLKRKCDVNFSVFDGRCQACPEGTHKPTVGFESCSPVPVPSTQRTELTTNSPAETIANLTANITGSSMDNERSRSQGDTTPGSHFQDKEADKAETKKTNASDGRVYLTLLSIPAFIIITVIVVILWKREKGGIRCDCRNCCLCHRISHHYQPTTMSEHPLPATTCEPRETTDEPTDHEEESPSSPPTYQSSDDQAMFRSHGAQDSGSIRSPRDSYYEEFMEPFIKPSQPKDQVNPPMAKTTDPSLSVTLPTLATSDPSLSWRFPTLATKEGSSLLQNGATRREADETSSREALLKHNNTETVQVPVNNTAPDAVADVTDASGVTDVADVADVADAVDNASATTPVVAEGFPEIGESLKYFDFGSSFSISEI